MTLHEDPLTGRIFPQQPFNTDVLRKSDSGKPVFDNEDFTNFTAKNWNWLGIENKATTRARIRGANFADFTRRGNRAQTHVQRDRFEFFDFSGGC